MGAKMGPKIRCKLCNDIIQSKHRHDFVYCRCKKIAVDGGGDYLRFIGDPENAETVDGKPIFDPAPPEEELAGTVKQHLLPAKRKS